MNLWASAILNLGTICLVVGKLYVSDEYFETVPGATVTINCPSNDGIPPNLYATEESLDTPELTDDMMISFTGFTVLYNVSEEDSKMYVCALPEKWNYTAIRIHLRVKEMSLYARPELVDKPRFKVAQLQGTPNRRRKQQQKKRRRQQNTERTTTDKLTTTPSTTTDPAQNPDNPPGAEPEELDDYKKRTELRKSLAPPSKPKVQKLNDTAVQVSWSINLNKKHPVQYFMIQYLDKNHHDDVIGGGSECHDAELVPAVLYWHNFDRLQPGHSYQFRVAAVYDGKSYLYRLGERGDWFSL